MANYRIPTEVYSEVKFTGMIYLFDFIFLMILIVVRMICLPFIHSSLHWYFTIFLAIFGVFMLIRPRSNPKKRMYQALLFSIARKKDDYSAIEYTDEKGND